MKYLETIKLLPASKKDLKAFATKIINSVLEGDVNPLELDVRLKYIEELIKSIRKDKAVKELTFEEAQKYGKTFDFANCEIRLSSRTTLNFKEDSEVLRLETELKARKELIKSVKDGIAIIDEDTGEQIQTVSSSSTEIITYKIK